MSDYNATERRAIERIREIDEALKAHGTGEALNVYATIRNELDSDNKQFNIWLRRLKTMLDHWHTGRMKNVQKAFYQYGPRRAQDVAFNSMIQCLSYRNQKIYRSCEIALKEMAQRRLVNTDDDDGIEFEVPEVRSINDIADLEIERGRWL